MRVAGGPAVATKIRAVMTSTARRGAGVAVAVLAGCAIAIQSRINGELGERLQDGIAAATISFSVGMLLVAVLTLAFPAGRRGLLAILAALRDRRLRPWQCLGGACGAYLVATQGLTVGSLGVALYTVAVVAGQSTSSLVVDRAGIGPSGRHPVTLSRLVGAALAIVAVVIAVADRLGQPGEARLAVLPAVAGLGIAWQQAVNGRVRVAAGAALPAAFVNFVAGTTTLLAAFAADVWVRGWPSGALPREPVLYLGGPLGLMFIAVAAVLVRVTGVLLLGLGMIAGQVTGALLVDLLAPAHRGGIGANTLAGAALTLLAVAVAVLPAPRLRR